MGVRTTRTKALLVAAACGLLLGEAACSSEDPTPAPSTSAPPSAPAPTPTEDPAQAKASADALAAYGLYGTAYEAASAKADYKSKELPKYVAEPLLGQLVNSFAQMSEAGVISRGESIRNPKVVDVDLDAWPATVTIEDCRDITAVVTVDAKTGNPLPAPSNRPKKYIVVSKAKKVGDKWYIYESAGDWNRPC